MEEKLATCDPVIAKMAIASKNVDAVGFIQAVEEFRNHFSPPGQKPMIWEAGTLTLQLMIIHLHLRLLTAAAGESGQFAVVQRLRQARDNSKLVVAKGLDRGGNPIITG